jgi:hypothetical protein
MSIYLEQQMSWEKYAQFEEWITRLRSGDIEQAHERLARGDGRCCLGVLRDVLGSDEPDTNGYLSEGYGILASGAGDDRVWDGHSHSELASLNDSCGAEFTDIADILEADFEGLLDGKPVELV